MLKRVESCVAHRALVYEQRRLVSVMINRSSTEPLSASRRAVRVKGGQLRENQCVLIAQQAAASARSSISGQWHPKSHCAASVNDNSSF